MQTVQKSCIAFFTVLGFLFLFPVCNYCQLRPFNSKHPVSIYTRIAHSMGMVWSWFEVTETTSNYFYQPDNPELIDSVVTIHEYFYNEAGPPIIDTVYTSVTDYSGTISFEEGLKYIHYVTSEGTIVDLIKNSMNHVIDYHYQALNSTNNKRIRSYYNSDSRLDSLKLSLSGITYTYFLEYDNFGHLLTITYGLEGSVNPFTHIIPMTYPSGYPMNQVEPDIDEILQYYCDQQFVEYRLIFDSHFQLYSFGGLDSYTPLYYPIYTNFPSLDIDFGDYHLMFDPNGYLTNYSYSYYYEDLHEDYSKSITFTWESITPNDDPVAPAPSNVLHVYPNPFRDNVKIEMQDALSPISEVAIYNIKGQLVKKWEGMKGNEVLWDGKDITNHSISSGVYLVKVKQNGKSLTSKIVKIQ